MVGILKALGANNNWTVRKVFFIQRLYLIVRGLFWGKFHCHRVVINLYCFWNYSVKPRKLLFMKRQLIHLPHILALNVGTVLICLLLIIPSVITTKISAKKTIRLNKF
jgi:ABC-type lipoprotein release transport system permease subunit